MEDIQLGYKHWSCYVTALRLLKWKHKKNLVLEGREEKIIINEFNWNWWVCRLYCSCTALILNPFSPLL